MTTIAVLGATGHLGGLAVDHLLAAGHAPDRLVTVGRATHKLSALTEQGVIVRAADYDEPATLDGALHGVDTVLLVSASEPGRRAPQHQNVIDAAVRAGVQRLVYTSLSRATESSHLLAPDHAATEKALGASGLAVTVLRNNWYIENFAADVERAAQTGVISASVGDGRIASATRSEYAEAAARVLLDDAHSGQTYELTGPSSWSYTELAEALTDVLARPVRYEPLSAGEQRDGLLAAGLDEGTAAFVVGLDANTRNGDLDVASDDLATLLGRTPLDLRGQLASLVVA